MLAVVRTKNCGFRVPDRVVAFWLTFNTANKIANGIMDNRVSGTLCDALRTGAPILAVLMVSNRLRTYPAWEAPSRRSDRDGVHNGWFSKTAAMTVNDLT